MGTLRDPSFKSRSKLVFSLQLLLKGTWTCIRNRRSGYGGAFNLEAERVFILARKQGELRATTSGRALVQLWYGEDGLDFVKHLARRLAS
jgi:hypothetical protein